MKSAFGCVGAWIGIFIGMLILPEGITPIFAFAIVGGGWWLGYSIAKSIEEGETKIVLHIQ